MNHTRVYRQYFLYSISYISTFYNMPPQVEGGGSTRSLKRKTVKEEVGSGLVKTSTSWSREEIKRIWTGIHTSGDLLIAITIISPLFYI